MYFGKIQAASLTKDSLYNATRKLYVENKTNFLTVRVFSLSHNDQVQYKSDRINNKNLIFKPNIPTNLGFSFNYQWLGLSISFINPGYKLEEKKKGRTSYFDLVLNTYGKKFGIDAYYLFYKGFYLSNPRVINLPGNPYPQMPDFITKSFGGTFYYFFNHKKYSYRAAFIQTEIQKKSAGSFVLYPYFSFFQLQLDSSLVSKGLSNERFEGGNLYTWGVGPGYAHTFVLKRFYFSLALLPSFYFQYQNLNLKKPEEIMNRMDGGVRFAAKLALGYNSKKFFMGISSTGDTYNVKLGKGTEMSYLIGTARLFFGYRFPLRLKFFPFNRNYESGSVLEKQ